MLPPQAPLAGVFGCLEGTMKCSTVERTNDILQWYIFSSALEHVSYHGCVAQYAYLSRLEGAPRLSVFYDDSISWLSEVLYTFVLVRLYTFCSKSSARSYAASAHRAFHDVYWCL